MDVDGFDPYEDDESAWRWNLEDMGERFQEQLKAKGITRRLRKPKPIDPQERMRKITTASEALEKYLDDVEQASKAADDLPRRFVECPECSGSGGVMVSHGNPSNGYDWEKCPICRGTGEIPTPGRPVFRFTGF